MAFRFLDYNEIHTFVDREASAHWDGWDVIIWSPNKRGFIRTDGAFVNGQWGTIRRIRPNKFGKWRLGVNI